MRNLILAALMAVLLFSCNNEKKEYVTVAGKIENVDIDSVYIYKDNFKKAIAITNGEFSDTLKLGDASYFYFLSDRERTEVYLNPGDSLYITTDMNQFDADLKYGGTLEVENGFLAQKQLNEQTEIFLNPAAFFSVSEDEFLKKAEEMRDTSLADLNSSKASSKFKKMEKKNIEYNYYMMLAQYHMANSYYNQEENEMPENFKEQLASIDLENENDFLSIPSYKDLVIHMNTQKIENAESSDDIEGILNDIKSAEIKNRMMRNVMFYKIAASDENSERFNTYIQENSSDEKLKKDAQEAFDKIQRLLPGSPSPKFDYPDINGNNVALDDLKGKLVYIDVWATWCAPCLAESPYLQQLIEDYEGKGLAVVGMSIDPQSDYGKWEAMVQEKGLKGIQIFADKDWGSQFVRDYGIMGIPRFILLDKEGKIIRSDAPRPSNTAIRTLIDQNI